MTPPAASGIVRRLPPSSVTEKIKAAIRVSIGQPYVWVLLGTTLPPVNVLWAAGFWLFAILRKTGGRQVCARWLNVQLTYTLILILPFTIGNRLGKLPGFQGEFVPGSRQALVAGITLGLISAAGVLLLVFFNTRALAESVLHRPPSAVPRLRFVGE